MNHKYYIWVAVFLICVIVYFSSRNVILAQKNQLSEKEAFISHTAMNKHKRKLRLASKPYVKLAKKYVPDPFGVLSKF